eukprot:4211133-Amphidinium_carterae.1
MGKVFTDGSAALPRGSQMRRAGFAIVFVEGSEILKQSQANLSRTPLQCSVRHEWTSPNAQQS